MEGGGGGSERDTISSVRAVRIVIRRRPLCTTEQTGQSSRSLLHVTRADNDIARLAFARHRAPPYIEHTDLPHGRSVAVVNSLIN